MKRPVEPGVLAREESVDREIDRATADTRADSHNTLEARLFEGMETASDLQTEAGILDDPQEGEENPEDYSGTAEDGEETFQDTVAEEILDDTIVSEEPENPADRLIDDIPLETRGPKQAEIDPERPESLDVELERISPHHYGRPEEYVHEVLEEHLGFVYDRDEYRISGSIAIDFDPESRKISLNYGFDAPSPLIRQVFGKAEGIPGTVRGLLGDADTVELDVYSGENDLNIDIEWVEDELEDGAYEALGHLLNVRDLHPIEYE